MKHTSEIAKKTEERKKVFTGKKRRLSAAGGFKKNRQGFRSVHELPTRS